MAVCKVYSLYIDILAEYLRSLRDVKLSSVGRVRYKTAVNVLYRVLYGNAEDCSAENRSVPYALLYILRRNKRSCPVMNCDIPCFL